MRTQVLLAALAASCSLAACSGGGGGPVTPAGGGGSGGSGTSQAIATQTTAIADANDMGTPIKDFSSFDTSSAASAGSASADASKQAAAMSRETASGTCNAGVEFYSPDRNNDTNSTETIVFYDSACTQEARDAVRTWSSTGTTAETVTVTVALYAVGNATPIATRSETHAFSNATFNKNGFPVAADGYDLVANDTLNISGSKTIVASRELVLGARTSGAQSFCSDSAGYNATGIASLNKTFGWQGGVLSGGTRTVNSDNSVTWQATHAGTAFSGPIGGLSISAGSQNTACPIATPMFTLAGGTSLGNYSIPITATFLYGVLESLSITNATLSNGDTLNAQTNSGQPPSSSQFITGSIASGTTQIATFAIDAFGDGTLTVTATGAQYVITDWHVVR